jgi:hypothetical protein
MSEEIDAPPTKFPEDWIGPGKRYATVEDMARDAMRWHDEAQAEKLENMQLRKRVENLRVIAHDFAFVLFGDGPRER